MSELHADPLPEILAENRAPNRDPTRRNGTERRGIQWDDGLNVFDANDLFSSQNEGLAAVSVEGSIPGASTNRPYLLRFSNNYIRLKFPAAAAISAPLWIFRGLNADTRRSVAAVSPRFDSRAHRLDVKQFRIAPRSPSRNG